VESFNAGLHAHSFIQCRARFSFGESRVSSLRRTYLTINSNLSAGSTPRRVQARTEMLSLVTGLLRGGLAFRKVSKSTG